MKNLLCCVVLFYLATGLFADEKAPPAKTVKQDYNQTTMTSKVYTLKHVKPEDIAPFIAGAVIRYNRSSSAKAIGSKDLTLLLVNMPESAVPAIDQLVEQLDKPPKNKNATPGIEGTGIATFTYQPKHRDGEFIVKTLRRLYNEEGLMVYYSKSKNMIYGKGPSSIVAAITQDSNKKINEIDISLESNDGDVVTKVFMLKHADPYEIRPILEAAVGTKRINGLKTGVSCIKYNDGRGAVIVSAEKYRFDKQQHGTSLEELVYKLDQPDAKANGDDKVAVYFPNARNARDSKRFITRMGLDNPKSPDEKAIVDPGTNAVLIKSAPFRQPVIKQLTQIDSKSANQQNQLTNDPDCRYENGYIIEIPGQKLGIQDCLKLKLGNPQDTQQAETLDSEIVKQVNNYAKARTKASVSIYAVREIGDYLLILIQEKDVMDGGFELVYSKKLKRIIGEFVAGYKG